MFIRTVLCAALFVPVAGMTPIASQPASKSTSPIIVPADTASFGSCAILYLGDFGGGECEFMYEVCDIPGWYFIASAPCNTAIGACPCDDPSALAQMPDIDGRPTAAGRGNGAFSGMSAPANVFRGAKPQAPKLSKGVELIYDGPAVVDGKPYRLFSIECRQGRFDIGYELTGVSEETMKSYPTGRLRAIFGNNSQAVVKVNGKARTFQLRSIGKSSVKEVDTDKPLVPTPDNTVPALK